VCLASDFDQTAQTLRVRFSPSSGREDTVDHIRRVVLGLGSNVGDRVKSIQQAVEELRLDKDIHVVKISPFYETTAEGPPQADFVNGAVLILTSLPAAEILQRSLKIEEKLGRVRVQRNEPRCIDIDVLWIEGESVSEPSLKVPHPLLRERSFALKPLLDLAPDARDDQGGALADLPAGRADLKRLPD
jgi:2-amino-4-hydroxy-6-hydroxymethyldihydropteridine diphosphokinase